MILTARCDRTCCLLTLFNLSIELINPSFKNKKVRGITQTKQNSEEIHIFAVKSDRSRAPLSRDKSTLRCTHWYRIGHDIGGCFQLHGYPDWWEDRNRGNFFGGGHSGQHAGSSAVVGRGCGGARAHAISAPGAGTIIEDSSSTSQQPVAALTNEPWTTLWNLIGNQKPSEQPSSNDRMMGPTLGELDWRW